MTGVCLAGLFLFPLLNAYLTVSVLCTNGR